MQYILTSKLKIWVSPETKKKTDLVSEQKASIFHNAKFKQTYLKTLYLCTAFL